MATKKFLDLKVKCTSFNQTEVRTVVQFATGVNDNSQTARNLITLNFANEDNKPLMFVPGVEYRLVASDTTE